MDTNLILGMDTSETLPNGYEQGFTWWIRTKLYLPTYLIDAKPLSQIHTDRLLHGYELPGMREHDRYGPDGVELYKT